MTAAIESLNPESRLHFVDELDTLQVRQLQAETAAAAGLPVGFRDPLHNGTEGPELAIIPPGRFEMGSHPDESGHQPLEAPRHTCIIRHAFAIGTYPVLTEEFERFRQDTEWFLRPELIWHKGRYPVINVRMEDTKLYLEWLSEQSGQHYRLPTEAEWEYAARAGTSTPFYHGEEISCREVHFNPLFPYPQAARDTKIGRAHV